MKKNSAKKRRNGYRRMGREINHGFLDRRFYDLVPRDYDLFQSEVNTATTPRHKEILGARSVHGHAVNGDKEFAIGLYEKQVHHNYINATIPDVVDAIIRARPEYARSVQAYKEECQALLDEVKGWIDAALDYILHDKKSDVYTLDSLLDSKGEPLMGISRFEHDIIKDPVAVLQGIYLGSYMDSEEWRQYTEDLFNSHPYNQDLRIHRGLCTAANVEQLKIAGLNILDLAHIGVNGEHEDPRGLAGAFSLKELKEMGIVLDYDKADAKIRKEGIPNMYPWTPVYVELQKGYGSSDDAAHNFVSLRHGKDAGNGLVLADAGDTIDKCTVNIKEKGEDELWGDHIKKRLGGDEGVKKHLGITGQDVANTIFAAAIDKNHPYAWPSCSQRRFLEKDSEGHYALRTHINYVKHIGEGTQMPKSTQLSISRVESSLFYKVFKERMRSMIKMGVMREDQFHYKRSLEYFIGKKRVNGNKRQSRDLGEVNKRSSRR